MMCHYLPCESMMYILLFTDVKLFLLTRFIQTYGTHIVVGMAVGGQDLLCVKQRPSSPIPPAELKGYLEELGDSLFSDTNSPILERKTKDDKKKVIYGHVEFMLGLVHALAGLHTALMLYLGM